MPPTAPFPPEPDNAEETFETRSALARYSGIAIQMFAIIGLGTWAGIWLDGHFHTKNPWYTVGLALLGVVLALMQVIRSATEKP